MLNIILVRSQLQGMVAIIFTAVPKVAERVNVDFEKNKTRPAGSRFFSRIFLLKHMISLKLTGKMGRELGGLRRDEGACQPQSQPRCFVNVSRAGIRARWILEKRRTNSSL